MEGNEDVSSEAAVRPETADIDLFFMKGKIKEGAKEKLKPGIFADNQGKIVFRVDIIQVVSGGVQSIACVSD